MEEILASIRRIIADDNSGPAPQPAAKPGAELDQAEIDHVMSGRDGAQQEADVLELTQPVEPAPTAFKAVRGPDVMFREEDRQHEPEPAPPPVPAAPPPPPAPRRAPPRENLLSPSSAANISAAFDTLANNVLAENARTLEDIVKEMLRPMLKQWLEENLPGLVERLVRAEIERVSRGAR
jgi:cell pole-organizing protein PopZ